MELQGVLWESLERAGGEGMSGKGEEVEGGQTKMEKRRSNEVRVGIGKTVGR